MAEAYGVTVILHTDHCAKKLLPWIDGLLDASEEFYAQHGKSLFSSHMIDLSEEPFFRENSQRIQISIIPDIESVNYGREVGYEIIEHIPPEEIGEILATKIREQMRSKGEL